jgi:hypothetical protein
MDIRIKDISYFIIKCLLRRLLGVGIFRQILEPAKLGAPLKNARLFVETGHFNPYPANVENMVSS